MARSKWHARCPGCGKKAATEHVGVQLLRFDDSSEQVDSYNYSVCPACHAAQYAEFYRKKDPKTWTLSKIPYMEVVG